MDSTRAHLPVERRPVVDATLLADINEVTYMSFGTGVPRVFIYNIDTNQKEIVGDFPTMSFAPRYSPDGNRIIMSLQSEDGNNSNIFEMNLQSRKLRQITDVAAINTAPLIRQMAAQIAFESDRGGTQQIYLMECQRRRAKPHQLWQGPLFHAGMVARWPMDCLHQSRGRQVLHWRDEA